MRTRAEANRQRWAILAVAVAVLVLSFVLLTRAYYQLVLTPVLLWAVLSLAWNILCGYSGYFSFGHAGFWGLGAYTVALGMMYFDLSPWISIPFCALVGAAAGAIIGYPTFRLRGHYFALAMLAYPLATLYVFQWLGYQELTLPMKREAPLLYMQFEDPRGYVVLALGLLVVALPSSPMYCPAFRVSCTAWRSSRLSCSRPRGSIGASSTGSQSARRWRSRHRRCPLVQPTSRRCRARRSQPAPIFWCCAISGSRSAGCARWTGSTSPFPRAGSTASSARTAPARRRCSMSSTGVSPRIAVRSPSPASRSPGCAQTKCAGAASGAPFRSCARFRA